MVAELRRKEKLTVFLTTHYMEEAADADYVILLDSGRVVGEGTPLALKNTYICICCSNSSHSLVTYR